MNPLPFSPLTDDALIAATIQHAAFGGDDGYVIAHQLGDAIKQRATGMRLSSVRHYGTARHLDVGAHR